MIKISQYTIATIATVIITLGSFWLRASQKIRGGELLLAVIVIMVIYYNVDHGKEKDSTD